MKVAVLGTGKIGSVLGTKWANSGHQVTYGVRNQDSPNVKALLAPGKPKISIETLSNAITVSDIILVAVPGTAVGSVVKSYAVQLNGKIIIDATNNIGANDMSGMQTFSTLTPDAKVFRAFNTLGWENFERPQFGVLQADLFYCGPDDAADLHLVEQLITEIGLRPVRIGGPEQIPLLDAVLKLWFSLASGQGIGRHLAFKMLT